MAAGKYRPGARLVHPPKHLGLGGVGIAGIFARGRDADEMRKHRILQPDLADYTISCYAGFEAAQRSRILPLGIPDKVARGRAWSARLQRDDGRSWSR